MLEQYCKIEDNDIVIRMPVSAFINGVLNSEYSWMVAEQENQSVDEYWKVVDEKVLAKDILYAMTEESEDGSSILSNAFDEGFKHLMEYSFSEGVDNE